VGFDSRRAAREIEEQLRAIGTPERAAGEKRYLKSELEHLGATVWQNRRTVKSFAKRHHDLSHRELIALIRALWSRAIFDCRLAACLLLDAYCELVAESDLDFLEQLVRESGTWALVDVLAGDVVGALLVRDPAAASALDRWAEDPDFWVRRSALLANLEPIKRGVGFERFSRYADAMLGEREFFIRKAIGWGLREAAKHNPAEVYQWLAPRVNRASGVTVREAVKYLQSDQRDQLLTAYQHRARRRTRLPQ
jgi:3-methyladenine DNA glycosylase AlkD